MKPVIAIIGAGGKMGMRCTENLYTAGYVPLLCEIFPPAVERIQAKGRQTTPANEALAKADYVVMAVPDTRLAAVTSEMIPQIKAGGTVIMLDPAVPCSGGILMRSDLGYLVTHPCHPPLFMEQPTPEARKDYFGGIAGTQDIVLALMAGPETLYAQGEVICRDLFAPVRDCHRVTVEQMAVLEPALSEVVAAGCAVVMREAVEVAVQQGVSREAAMAFMLGHIQIALAICFGAVPSPFSDAAKVASELGKRWVFQPNWQKVFEKEKIQETISIMLNPEKLKTLK